MSDNNEEIVIKRRKKIIQDLDDIEETSFVLPSAIKADEDKRKEEKKKKETEVLEESTSDWLASISSFKTPKIKKHSKDLFGELYSPETGKKKKKKKKKPGELTDYNKEFEPEMALLNNQLRDQKNFVDSLQARFDAMEGGKSSARGIGKYTVDLANAITSARNLSNQILRERVNLKKTISDLSFKEKKEFGVGNGEGANMDSYASNYLKQLMSARGTLTNGLNMDDFVGDGTEDDLFDSLSGSLGEDERDSDVEKYLKYENQDVSIYVLLNPNDFKDYDFVAETKDGQVLLDYPLPEKTSLNVNTSTMKATDAYGSKYTIIFKED